MTSRTDVSPSLPTSVGWTLSGRGGYGFVGKLDEVRLSNAALHHGQFLNQTALFADAGPGQSADEGTPVVCLDGSASTGEGSIIFSWQQVAPPDCPAPFDNPDSPTPCFATPLLPGGVSGSCTLTFQLTVTDAAGFTATDTTDVTVKNVNHPPVADAGPDQTVNEGSAVALTATNTYDPDNDTIVSYLWVQTDGELVTLAGDDTPQPSFAAPLLSGGFGASEILSFEVTASDGDLSGTDSVQVTVEQVNHPPTAAAGPDQTKSEGSLVTLNGTASNDPDGDPLVYIWSQASNGAPPVELSDPASPTPTFTAPAVGPGGVTVDFSLVVSDGQAWSARDSVAINVQDLNDPPACAAAQASPANLWPPNHKMVGVSVVGVTDPQNNQVTIVIAAVTQDEPVNGIGDGDSSPDAILQGATALLRAERSGTGNGRVYRISFTADDGQGGVCSGAVTVGVPLSMRPRASVIDDGQIYDSTQP